MFQDAYGPEFNEEKYPKDITDNDPATTKLPWNKYIFLNEDGDEYVPEDEDFPDRDPFDYHNRRGENLSRPLSSSPTFFTSSSSEVPATSSKSSSCSSSSSSSSSSSTSSSSSSSSKRIRRVPEDEDFPHRSPFDYHDRRGENLSPTRTSCKTIRRKKKKNT